VLYLFYSSPSSARARSLGKQLATTLSELGFPGAAVETAQAGDSAVLGVQARPFSSD
jgi:hypothetical protein